MSTRQGMMGNRGSPAAATGASTQPTTSFFTSRATPSSSSKRLIGDYLLGKTLGAGSMGKVKMATHQRTGLKVACKIVPRPHSDADPDADPKTLPDADNKEVRVVREAAILQLLRHPNVVRLYDMVVERRYFYLFFEYVSGGQMLDYIISHGRLKERIARKFMRQLVSAVGTLVHGAFFNTRVDYCHRNSVIHRDLKIENVLLTDTGRIKLIDFGLANLYSPRSLLKTFCGSLYFAAPELLNARPYVGPEVDIWSLGVILYVLVCGKVPFDDQSMPVLHAKIKRGIVDYPSHLSAECRGLLQRMLMVDSMARATMAEVRVHTFLNKGHSHPPITHLPPRKPLRLPLNPEVIRKMTGFQFGTEREIREHLEGIVAAWEERRKLAVLMSESGFDEKLAVKELERRKLAKGKQVASDQEVAAGAGVQVTVTSAAPGPTMSPAEELENDFEDEIANGGLQRDPMVSVYYLVREKMEREARGEEEAAEEYWEREKALEREREARKRERRAAYEASKAQGAQMKRTTSRGSSTGASPRMKRNTAIPASAVASVDDTDAKAGFFRRRTTISSQPKSGKELTASPTLSSQDSQGGEGTMSRIRRAMTTDRKSLVIPADVEPSEAKKEGVFRRISQVIRTGADGLKPSQPMTPTKEDMVFDITGRSRPAEGLKPVGGIKPTEGVKPAEGVTVAGQDTSSVPSAQDDATEVQRPTAKNELSAQPSDDSSLLARLQAAEMNARVAATDNQRGIEVRKQTSKNTAYPAPPLAVTEERDEQLDAVKRYASMLANPDAFQAPKPETVLADLRLKSRHSMPPQVSQSDGAHDSGALKRLVRRLTVRKDHHSQDSASPSSSARNEKHDKDFLRHGVAHSPNIPESREEQEEEVRPKSRHGPESARMARSATSPPMMNSAALPGMADKEQRRPGTMEDRVEIRVESRRRGLKHRVSGLWNRALNRGGTVRDDRRRTISDLAELDERPSTSASRRIRQDRPNSYQSQGVPVTENAMSAISEEAPPHSPRNLYPPPARNPNTLLSAPAQAVPLASSDDGEDGAGTSSEDVNVKKVYLKGLFSVATTSTRPALEVRARLLRAFEELHLNWRELPRVRFEIRYKYIFGADSVEYILNEEEKKWTREVHFEVSVVKVPWLFGVHGVRFHRVSGDAWRYKECCEKILDKAKL